MSGVIKESLLGVIGLQKPKRRSRIGDSRRESDFSEDQFQKAQSASPLARVRGQRTRTVSNISQSRERLSAFFFLCRAEEVKLWIQEVRQQVVDCDLATLLKDGTVLCELFNIIYPNSIPKIHTIRSTTSAYLALENIQFFLTASAKIGVNTRCEPFMPIDLYEEKNIPKVVNFILGFESTARNNGFKIALKRLNSAGAKFTEAQILKAQESLKMNKNDNLSALFHSNAEENKGETEEEEEEEEEEVSEEESEEYSQESEKSTSSEVNTPRLVVPTLSIATSDSEIPKSPREPTPSLSFSLSPRSPRLNKEQPAVSPRGGTVSMPVTPRGLNNNNNISVQSPNKLEIGIQRRSFSSMELKKYLEKPPKWPSSLYVPILVPPRLHIASQRKSRAEEEQKRKQEEVKKELEEAEERRQRKEQELREEVEKLRKELERGKSDIGVQTESFQDEKQVETEERAEQEKRELNLEVEELRKANEMLQVEKDKIQVEMKEQLDNQSKDLNAELEKLRQLNSSLQNENSKFQVENSQLTSKCESLSNELENIKQTLQTQGSDAKLQLEYNLEKHSQDLNIKQQLIDNLQFETSQKDVEIVQLKATLESTLKTLENERLESKSHKEREKLSLDEQINSLQFQLETEKSKHLQLEQQRQSDLVSLNDKHTLEIDQLNSAKNNELEQEKKTFEEQLRKFQELLNEEKQRHEETRIKLNEDRKSLQVQHESQLELQKQTSTENLKQTISAEKEASEKHLKDLRIQLEEERNKRQEIEKMRIDDLKKQNSETSEFTSKVLIEKQALEAEIFKLKNQVEEEKLAKQSVEQQRQADIEKLRSENSFQVEKMKSEHSIQLEKMKQEHTSSMTFSLQQEQSVFSEQRNQLELQLEEQKRKLQESENQRLRDIAAMQEEFKLKMEQMKFEYETRENKRNEDKLQFEEKMKNMNFQVEKEKSNAQEIKEQMMREKEQEKQENKEQLRKMLDEEKQKYESELLKLKTKLEEESRSRDLLNAQHNLQLESLKQDHQRQLNSVQSEHIQKSLQERQKFESSLSAEKAKYTSSESLWKQELEKIKNSYDLLLEQEKSEKEDVKKRKQEEEELWKSNLAREKQQLQLEKETAERIKSEEIDKIKQEETVHRKSSLKRQKSEFENYHKLLIERHEEQMKSAQQSHELEMEMLKTQLLKKSQSGAETVLLKDQEIKNMKKELEFQKQYFEKELVQLRSSVESEKKMREEIDQQRLVAMAELQSKENEMEEMQRILQERAEQQRDAQQIQIQLESQLEKLTESVQDDMLIELKDQIKNLLLQMQTLKDDKTNAEMLASRTGAELLELKQKYEALEEEVEKLRALLAAKEEVDEEEKMSPKPLRKQMVKTKSATSMASKIPVRSPTKTKPGAPPTITIDLNQTKKKDFKMYKPNKDDPLDMFLASFLNGQEKEFIPSENIKRVSSGVYIFGTTKVHLRCINGKLIARIGGGWMELTEFLKRFVNHHVKSSGGIVGPVNPDLDSWKTLEITYQYPNTPPIKSQPSSRPPSPPPE